MDLASQVQNSVCILLCANVFEEGRDPSFSLSYEWISDWAL